MPDKLQQEIEDLLARLDTLPARRPLRYRARDMVRGTLRGAARLVPRVRLPHISAGHILLGAIALIIVAYVAEPGGTDVARWLIVAGIIGFIGAFIISLRRSPAGGRAPEKRWRGEPMELGGPGVGSRLRSWWGRWRTRR